MISSVPSLVRCLIFFSLHNRISGVSENNEDPGNTASNPQPFWPEYNFGENADETVITDPDETEEDEEFDDNRLGKISVENLKLYKEILEAQRKRNESEMILQRKVRERRFKTMKCFSCFGSNDEIINVKSNNTDSQSCYKGINISTTDCGFDTKECFTELHPFYIKRGCYEPKKLNITFYCKCTLCNDKPADNRDYFVYENVKDWTFDNRRLQLPNLPGVTAACKYCNTTATGYIQTCLDGTNVEYTICKEGQICFTSIDKYKGVVVRGCANKPAYNSFFDYCTESGCNNEDHWTSNLAQLIYGNRTQLVKRTTNSVIRSNKIDKLLLFLSIINLHSI